jgi:hypothetical protein
MTYSGEPRDDYRDQGQQDDYFVQDLTAAEQQVQENMLDDMRVLQDYHSQGQQNEDFHDDLVEMEQQAQAKAVEERRAMEESQN